MEDIVGRRVVAVTNLQPAKMRESRVPDAACILDGKER
jgi:tRNA-binding EMAP/Myf-like protein